MKNITRRCICSRCTIGEWAALLVLGSGWRLGWLHAGVNIPNVFAALLLPVPLARSLPVLFSVASIVQRGQMIAITSKILRAKKTARPIGGENAPVIHVILSQIFSPKSYAPLTRALNNPTKRPSLL